MLAYNVCEMYLGSWFLEFLTDLSMVLKVAKTTPILFVYSLMKIDLNQCFIKKINKKVQILLITSFSPRAPTIGV